MAGDINDAEAVVVSLTPRPSPGRRGEIEGREADVDGDAASFFFGEAVAVNAGKGLDERRFAVIDMASGAEDEIARHEGIIGEICPKPRHRSISLFRPANLVKLSRL